MRFSVDRSSLTWRESREVLRENMKNPGLRAWDPGLSPDWDAECLDDFGKLFTALWVSVSKL